MRHKKRQENIPSDKAIIRSRLSMTQMSWLSEMKFRRIMINVKDFNGKSRQMQDQMDNFKETETVRLKWKC